MTKTLTAIAVALTACSCSPRWPSDVFPAEMEMSRTLFVGGGGLAFRETCEAMVVELTQRAAMRVIYAPQMTLDKPWSASPRNGWLPTPMPGSRRTRHGFEGAFSGCNDDGEGPLGDFQGALSRPGAYYRILNGGEGVAIISPRAKLAGYFYAG